MILLCTSDDADDDRVLLECRKIVGNCAESVLLFILRHLTQETLTVGSVYCRVIIHCRCHCYRRMFSLREGEKVMFSVMSTCLFTVLWSQVNKSE